MFQYSTSAPKNPNLKGNPLNPNHSHFILVDNSEFNYGGEVEFRGKLEKEIVSFGREADDSSNKAPIVVLVVGGGANTVNTVLSSVENGSPCVFIDVKIFRLNFFCTKLIFLQ